MAVFGLVVAAVAAVGVLGFSLGRTVSPAPETELSDAPPDVVTAPVERRALTSSVVVRGSAEYAASAPLVVAGSVGQDLEAQVLTRIVPAGSILQDGDGVAEISGRPVFVVQGATPMFRSMKPGMEGPDVAQLEAALVRFGLDPGPVDGVFDVSTSAAVEAWYEGRGYVAVGPSGAEQADLASLLREQTAAQEALRQAEEAVRLASASPSVVELAELDAAVADAQTQYDRSRAAAGLAATEARASLAAAQADLDTAQSAWETAAAQVARAESTGVDSAGVPCEASCREALAGVEGAARAARDGAQARVEIVRAQAARQEADAAAEIESARRGLGLATLRRSELVTPEPGPALLSAVEEARARLDRAAVALAEASATAGARLPAGELIFVPSLPLRAGNGLAAVGERVAGPLITASAPDVVVIAGVPPEVRDQLDLGGSVQMSSAGTGEPFTGTVTRIAERPGGDGIEAGRFAVTIVPDDVSTAETIAGSAVVVTAPLASTSGDVLVVPVAAVRSIADGTSQVEVRRADGIAERVVVDVGLVADGYAEVRPQNPARLRAGDRVVVGSSDFAIRNP